MSASSTMSRLAAVVACLGVVVFASQASAIPVGTAFFKKAQMNAAKQTQSHASDQQIREALHVLNSVEHTLKHADHDYGGHRVHAIHAVNAAEHQLKLIHEHHHKHHGTKPAAAKGTKGKGNKGQGEPEPQKLSDAQLASSAKVLTQTAAFISNANHDFGGHRTKAIKDIHHAVAQLHLALKYSAAHNADKK